MATTTEGWLWKKGEKGLVKAFKKRFFRVIGDRVVYAEDPSKLATAPAGFIDLNTVTKFELNNAHVTRRTPGKGLEVHTNSGRIYYLIAESESEMGKWQRFFDAYLAAHERIDDASEQPSLFQEISSSSMKTSNEGKGGEGERPTVRFESAVEEPSKPKLNRKDTPASSNTSNNARKVEIEQQEGGKGDEKSAKAGDEEHAYPGTITTSETLDAEKDDEALNEGSDTLRMELIEMDDKAKKLQDLLQVKTDECGDLREDNERLKQKLEGVLKEASDLKTTSWVAKYKEKSDEHDMIKRDNAHLKDKLRSVSEEAAKVPVLEAQVVMLSQKLAAFEHQIEKAHLTERKTVRFLQSISRDLRPRSGAISSPKLTRREGDEGELSVPAIKVDGPEDDKTDEGDDSSVAVVAKLLAQQLQELPTYHASERSIRLTKEFAEDGDESPVNIKESLAVQLSAKEAEVTALKAKLAALEAEAEGGLGGSKARETVSEQEAELQATVVRLNKDLSEAHATIARYSEEKKELDAKVQKVTERVQEWNDRRQQETDTLNALRKANEELQKVVEELKAKAQVNQRTGDEVAGLQRQVESYKASSASLQVEVEKLRSKVGALGEVEELRKTISENESFLKLAKVAEEEHAETIAAYEAEVKRLQAQLEARSAPSGPNVPSSGEEAVQLYVDLSKEAEKMKIDLFNAREQLSILQRKYDALVEKHAAVVDTLKNKDELLLAASTTLREYKQRLNPDAAGEVKTQRLIDQLAAHQSQNAMLLENLAQLEQTMKIEANAMAVTKGRLAEELAAEREKFTQLLSKCLSKEGVSVDVLRETEHVKRELFYSLTREIKAQLAARAGQYVQVDIAQLYDSAKKNSIPWKEWDLWIKAELKSRVNK